MNNFKQFLKTKFGLVLFWTIYSAVLFLGIQFLVQIIMLFIAQYFEDSKAVINSPIFNAIYVSIFFSLMSFMIYFIPKKYFGFRLDSEYVGISEDFRLKDIGIGFIGFLFSMILSGLILEIANSFLPNFDVAQPQELGFSGLIRPYEFVIAFICLAIIPPFAEEFMFRGVLYGQFRKINVVFGVIFTSLLFGLAHRQLNVSIITFVMSVVMCLMREKITGSIWAGIFVHFMKNSIAFMMLYILPNFLL